MMQYKKLKNEFTTIQHSITEHAQNVYQYSRVCRLGNCTQHSW